ncbi:ubiquinone biosynthesis protein UbiJ [Hydromonas duriensis]|uniref:Ubiquinone biosynthesis protein UbiJ n=2 Tax=Hydromonas duriensis TaxID=1527608 RepID=A0A4R6Y7S4_9BURK|nr:ubiquinone biosynthesis protein UbiJ [Hydromonas duriensis]
MLSSRLAQMVALAVRKMAANEPWVARSALPHEGQVIGVALPVLGRVLDLRWRVSAADILHVVPAQTPVSVQLDIAPSVYNSLAQLPFDMQRVMRHVHISGDAQLAEWVNRLAQQLRPDVWEDLAKVVGDIPSFYAQQGADKLFKHFKNMVSTLTQQVQHAVLDDTPVLVRHRALSTLADDAQQLRYATERLEQRVALLKQKMQGGAS